MKKVLIKIGGRAASDTSALSSMAAEIAELQNDYSFFLVHGGGAEVTRISEIFGLKAVFEDGIRKTTEEEMDVVDMVLAGKMNKYIVRLLAAAGIKAAGLSGCDGAVFTGEAVSEGSRTGRVTATSPEILLLLSDNGLLPVISSVSMDGKGKALNINADEAALAVAVSIPADNLVFISDIPGIMKNEKIIKMLTVGGAESEITAGVIGGGMIPKVRSSMKALKEGVGAVIVGGYSGKGDLKKLLEGKLGTRIIG
jgi:acetylglutamate kinase